MIAGAGLALNALSNRSSASNRSCLILDDKNQVVWLTKIVGNDETADRMNPELFGVVNGRCPHRHFVEGLPSNDPFDRVFATLHQAVVAVSQSELPPILVGGGAKILDAPDAVHGQRRVIGPENTSVCADQNDTVGQPDDDLLELAMITSRFLR